MRKFISVMVVSLLLASVMLMPASASSISSEEISTLEPITNYDIEHYEYPITADSPDWFDYTVLEKVKMLTIPESILGRMTDEALIQAIADYPYLVDLYVYGNAVSDGIITSQSYFSALQELLSRETAVESLSTYGVSFANAVNTVAATDDEIDNHDKLAALSMDYILNYARNPLVSDATVASPRGSTSGYVYTPSGLSVPAVFYDSCRATRSHSVIDQELIDTYNVIKVRSGSCYYNCHSYAWYSRSSSNRTWIPDAGIYTTDSAYTRIYNGGTSTSLASSGIANGDIVFYGSSGTHSAVFIGNAASTKTLYSGLCQSKWGMAGLFQHALGNVPSSYTTSRIYIYRD